LPPRLSSKTPLLPPTRSACARALCARAHARTRSKGPGRGVAPARDETRGAARQDAWQGLLGADFPQRLAAQLQGSGAAALARTRLLLEVLRAADFLALFS